MRLEAAFTLIEVCIALVLLSVSLLWLDKLLSSHRFHQEHLLRESWVGPGIHECVKHF